MSPRGAPPPEGARPLPQARLSLPRANVFTRQPHAHVCCSLFVLEMLTLRENARLPRKPHRVTLLGSAVVGGLEGWELSLCTLMRMWTRTPGVQCFWPHCAVFI